MGKTTVWHDEKWTCLLVDDGASKSTVSLTRLEAADLRDKLVPPDAIKLWDSHGDAGEAERLYGLTEGYVLTASDIRDLQNLIADTNDLIGNSANSFHDGRLHALREIGGDTLVKAYEQGETATVNAVVERTMAKFAERAKAVSHG